ncbi:hypothetical protein Pelo_16139 [Pelomyxa schiedti]|nr:hypothetical protein Pelo_16139 [Pelomyxa schiedti]
MSTGGGDEASRQARLEALRMEALAPPARRQAQRLVLDEVEASTLWLEVYAPLGSLAPGHGYHVRPRDPSEPSGYLWLERDPPPAIRGVPPWVRRLDPADVDSTRGDDPSRVHFCGLGAFSQVWRGVWESGEVAVKKLNKDMLVRVQEDLLVYVKLPWHPNIVPCFAATPDLGALVLECESFSLGAYLREDGIQRQENGLSPKEISWVAADIACGLRFLHSCGFMHNDLTPDNVLMSPNWHVKLADLYACTFLMRDEYPEPACGCTSEPGGEIERSLCAAHNTERLRRNLAWVYTEGEVPWVILQLLFIGQRDQNSYFYAMPGNALSLIISFIAPKPCLRPADNHVTTFSSFQKELRGVYGPKEDLWALGIVVALLALPHHRKLRCLCPIYDESLLADTTEAELGDIIHRPPGAIERIIFLRSLCLKILEEVYGHCPFVNAIKKCLYLSSKRRTTAPELCDKLSCMCIPCLFGIEPPAEPLGTPSWNAIAHHEGSLLPDLIGPTISGDNLGQMVAKCPHYH